MEIPIEVEVPGGPRLEARLAESPTATGGLVLCHPHPLYGGDLDNPVIVRAAEVAQGLGLTTLRFNFRGVGASGGTHGGGITEADDVRAALARARAALPVTAPLGLLGYSFGAWVSARAAAKPPARLLPLCLVAPPLGMLDWTEVPIGATGAMPLLIVAGTRDQYCPLPDLERFTARLTGARATIIEGADHFFFGKLYPMGLAIQSWLREWAGGSSAALPGQPGGRGGAG
jgi:alpha/beta superfamily hydrolase